MTVLIWPIVSIVINALLSLYRHRGFQIFPVFATYDCFYYDGFILWSLRLLLVSSIVYLSFWVFREKVRPKIILYFLIIFCFILLVYLYSVHIEQTPGPNGSSWCQYI